MTGAGNKGRQEATLCVRRSADAEWIATAGSGDRLETDGTPVRASDPLCIVHAMSHEALAAVPGELYPTDFGESGVPARRGCGYDDLHTSPYVQDLR